MNEKITKRAVPNSNWLRHMADAEDNCVSISVGGLAHDQGMLQEAAAETPRVFGRLIEFARRERGMSVEELAIAANVDLAEIVAIETKHDASPRPRTIVQLAQVLKLPALQLTELLSQPRKSLSDAAVRFAARCEPTTKLTEYEKAAFEEFVKVLAEPSDGG